METAMSGSFQADVVPGSTTIVALPPCQNTGIVQFGRVFLSLATDFEDGIVRLAIGQPGQWRIEDPLDVPIGRKVVRELVPGDEVASVIQRGGGPISLLIEYQ
jgi:hypothetical protein